MRSPMLPLSPMSNDGSPRHKPTLAPAGLDRCSRPISLKNSGSARSSIASRGFERTFYFCIAPNAQLSWALYLWRETSVLRRPVLGDAWRTDPALFNKVDPMQTSRVSTKCQNAAA